MNPANGGVLPGLARSRNHNKPKLMLVRSGGNSSLAKGGTCSNTGDTVSNAKNIDTSQSNGRYDNKQAHARNLGRSAP